ncbi:MAG: tRNA threonylcarbamoyladenosine dehydratase [Gammaproteobacteria bacterium]|nr:tRNA threonylcarbamoyladenosine dehydratase [Gammaproteobacteria bacterium]
MENSDSPDLQRRFGGISRLFGENSLRRYAKAHICIIGIGGVGSWAVEALARSAIGEITLIDMDHIAESNINRQLPALSSTLGKNKIEVMSERIRQINPDCSVHLVDDFLSQENIEKLIKLDMDFVIDCIDDFRLKAALIHSCKSRNISLVTTGGAGGKADPSRIQQTDLARSEQDPLLAKTRSLLRQRYNFPRNVKRKFRIASVWSDEQQVFQWDDGSLRHQRPQTCSNQSLNCGGLGSSMPVTATFGTIAAAYVLEKLR